jgi:Predicted membrane protein
VAPPHGLHDNSIDLFDGFPGRLHRLSRARGEKSSGYRGWIAAIYFPMLASHVLLAFATLPLVILTLIPVFRRRWDRHRRIARWTIPIWLYVSVTGVLVYLMLYKWFPPPNLALGH